MPWRGLGDRFATAPLYALPPTPPSERNKSHYCRKCVTTKIRECAPEGARRSIRHGASLRTSALTPNRVAQKEHRLEVREGRNPGMCPGGGWKVASRFARARRCKVPPAGDAWEAGSLEVRAPARTYTERRYQSDSLSAPAIHFSAPIKVPLASWREPGTTGTPLRCGGLRPGSGCRGSIQGWSRCLVR